MSIARRRLLVASLLLAAACAPEPPTRELIERQLRADNEKPAPPGEDGAITVEVHELSIGKPRPWTASDGGGGRAGTRVWPTQVHWSKKTHFQTRTHVVERRSTLAVFKNGAGAWELRPIPGPGQSEDVRDEMTFGGP